MSVQRFSMEAPTGVIAVMAPYKYGNYVRYADHVHIVQEMEQAHAAALADANLRWDAEVTRALDEGEKIGRADAEQAHAAALAEERASEFARIRSLIAEHGPKGWKVCGDWALRLMDDPESGGAA